MRKVPTPCSHPNRKQFSAQHLSSFECPSVFRFPGFLSPPSDSLWARFFVFCRPEFPQLSHLFHLGLATEENNAFSCFGSGIADALPQCHKSNLYVSVKSLTWWQDEQQSESEAYKDKELTDITKPVDYCCFALLLWTWICGTKTENQNLIWKKPLVIKINIRKHIEVKSIKVKVF